MRLDLKLVETKHEMEAALALRVEVFVYEQGGPLDEEPDEHDAAALQAIALLNGSVVGTGRLYTDPSGEARIGRMAVDARRRRQGIGSRILSFLEDQARQMGVDSIALHAQTYVRDFYQRAGYAAEGEPFIEAGIEHIRMIKRLTG